MEPVVPPRIAAMPRFDLTGGPSPLTAAPRFSAALGGRAEIWLKREDLLPLAFGGNKIRNLELLVGAALAAGADTLVTAGRRWSNHCRLTAAAGARAGLDVHLALSGPPGGAEPPNERLARLLGATVHVTAGEDRSEREALVERVVGDLMAEGRHPYVIGVGGTGSGEGDVTGACGQVLAGLELAAQAGAIGLDVSSVVVPTATGGTHAGVLTGLRVARSRADVLGVAVSAAAAEASATVAGIVGRLSAFAGLEPPPGDGAIQIDGEQLGDGYGAPTLAAGEAARLLARTEGVLVDPIYTAKALAALVACVRDGRLGGTVVFWHAGGLPALFAGPAEGG
jgi:1-aminocyclopropane-1-carboxylate deaminase/D-cysteine desulfhydrase-like pyridoxal-dependent ACC family enzyme